MQEEKGHACINVSKYRTFALWSHMCIEEKPCESSGILFPNQICSSFPLFGIKLLTNPTKSCSNKTYLSCVIWQIGVTWIVYPCA